MESFVYHVPTKVYFGENRLTALGGELKKLGSRVLLTYGGGSIKKSGLYDAVLREIKSAGLELYELGGIAPNPRVDSVREGAKICKERGIDVLLAVGGGSVIDCTKYIGAAAFYDGDAWDISCGKADVKKCLPIVTVLTLSATGSEMNCGGVISNPATHEKIGRLFPQMLPKVSFLDPTYTYSVSRYQTACGSADILSHILEVYFSPDRDLEMLDEVMEGLVRTVVKFTPTAMEKPDDYDARANLMWASSWAINTFVLGAKMHDWTCHPIEHELSAYYDITHGLGLAILTPRWLRYVLDAQTAPRIKRLGVRVFGLDGEGIDIKTAEQTILCLEKFLFETCGLSSTLSAIGIDERHFDAMANSACAGGAIEGYKTLKAEDVKAILKNCL